MPPRADRLLHVLVLAPAISLLAIVAASTAHVRGAAAAEQPPAPVVIAIDPGHGGSADNAHPDRPFDPGVIGVNGTVEKDVTLDVAMRTRQLLADDSVRVVMTRTDDRYVGVEARIRQAADARAELFVSIHANGYPSAAVHGALVVYPSDADVPFAETVRAAVAAEMAPLGLADGGLQLKADLWAHAPMPAVTLEAGYLTNPVDAALLSRGDVRAALAQALRMGIEKQDPGIAARRSQIASWNAAHPDRAVTADSAVGAAAPRPAADAGSASPGGLPEPVKWLILVAAVALAVRCRRLIGRALLLLLRVLALLLRALLTRPARQPARRPAGLSRSQRAARRSAALSRTRRSPYRRAVYDRIRR